MSLRACGGGCHCGALRYVLEWPVGERMPARRCACSYCRCFEGEWTSSPRARLSLLQPPGAARAYRFGTHTADFVACAVCGVVVVALGGRQGERIAVVNARSLDGYAHLDFDRSDSDFAGETREARLARRERNWISTVDVREARA